MEENQRYIPSEKMKKDPKYIFLVKVLNEMRKKVVTHSRAIALSSLSMLEDIESPYRAFTLGVYMGMLSVSGKNTPGISLKEADKVDEYIKSLHFQSDLIELLNKGMIKAVVEDNDIVIKGITPKGEREIKRGEYIQ